MKAWLALVLALALLLPASHGERQARSHLLPADFLTYDDLLPADQKEEVLSALRTVPFGELLSKPWPYLHFLSGEVLGKDGSHTAEYVNLIRAARWDIWLDRRRVHGDDGENPETWSLATILVDKQRKPRRAYYFDFLPAPLAAGSLPKPVRFEVGCVTCHANGPKVIRPIPFPRHPGFTAEERARLAAWNEIITSYGPIENYIPRRLVGLTPVGQAMQEPLRHRACVGCHDDHSGIRSSLKRLNRMTIFDLVVSSMSPEGYYVGAHGMKEAIMPMEAPPLSKNELHCLITWLSHEPDLKAEGCNDRGESMQPGPIATGTGHDPGEIPFSLEAIARSTIHQFAIRGFASSGDLRCDQKCSGSLELDLRGLRTGIDLRDRHLRERYLRTERYPKAFVTVAPFTPERVVHTTVALTLAGEAASYPVTMTCRGEWTGYRCRLEAFSLQLSRHRIDRPRFLGISLEDAVAVHGEFLFRRQHFARQNPIAAGGNQP